ncbi:hypothetical protein V8094_004587 [Vibrio parahaemolyticus]|nr:hypothetical protein [Vibrio parahaemolyticus]HCE4593306.1 hypothetical protein [Vibrio parahaemolyticus]HCG5928399.1 hypothetical protein [Vibrio parahaemolyticus]
MVGKVAIPGSHADDDANSVISIPVGKKDLGSFICDLLGQKQSLERTYDVVFEVDHSWLMNLHDMIDQRISQQANSNLINFSAVVYFENGSKRTITTVDAFRGYHETKPHVSTGVKVVWEYLVHFPNRPHPEKQQISFSAHVYEKKNTEKSTNVDRLSKAVSENAKDSLINIQIDHTERTWGDDIENIISSCVAEISHEDDLKDNFLKISRFVLFIAIMAFTLVYPIYSAQSVSGETLDTLHNNFLELSNHTEATNELINKKLDMLFEAVSTIESNRNSRSMWSLAFTFLGPIVAVIFLSVTKTARQSHILLSPRSNQLRDKLDKKNKGKVLIVILSYVLSIAAGVLANYSFQYLNA